MKKFFSIIIAAIVIASVFVMPVSADEEIFSKETVEYYKNLGLQGTVLNVYNWGEYIDDEEIDVISHDQDNHHVVEDVAITLGNALLSALGDKKGIIRYGEKILPMDEALILAAVDVSGRIYSKVDVWSLSKWEMKI